eukprot:Phypoly_transcript_05602.p2 GENE.Phypoly_transcript_05602~~Phypoly_transcript_05602.p2  ORF type:complete len:112 (+),score=36.02 Phypoly_transcript_05602:896-1231(+)
MLTPLPHLLTLLHLSLQHIFLTHSLFHTLSFSHTPFLTHSPFLHAPPSLHTPPPSSPLPQAPQLPSLHPPLPLISPIQSPNKSIPNNYNKESSKSSSHDSDGTYHLPPQVA